MIYEKPVRRQLESIEKPISLNSENIKFWEKNTKKINKDIDNLKSSLELLNEKQSKEIKAKIRRLKKLLKNTKTLLEEKKEIKEICDCKTKLKNKKEGIKFCEHELGFKQDFLIKAYNNREISLDE